MIYPLGALGSSGKWRSEITCISNNLQAVVTLLVAPPQTVKFKWVFRTAASYALR